MNPYDVTYQQFEDNVVSLLEQSLVNEAYKTDLYEFLVGQARIGNKEVLRDILKDEERNTETLLSLYQDFSDTDFIMPPTEPLPLPENYIEGLKTAFLLELDEIKIKSRIKNLMPNIQTQNMMFEIITNDQDHAMKLLYILCSAIHGAANK